jgi:hypothetical protein
VEGYGRLRGVGSPSLLRVMMLEGRQVGAPWLIVCSRRICQAMCRLRRNALIHLRRGRRAGVRTERMWLIVCSTHFDNGKSAALADDSRVLINPLRTGLFKLQQSYGYDNMLQTCRNLQCKVNERTGGIASARKKLKSYIKRYFSRSVLLRWFCGSCFATPS